MTDRLEKGVVLRRWVLGAAQYTGGAEMLKDQSPLVRCDALIALGIMHAVSQVSNVAGLLEDKQNFVRPYAAVALLLMQDQTQSRKIQALLGSDQVAMSRIDACVRLHPVLNGRSDELVAIAAAELQKLR